jgi:hypothetical protein
MNEALSSTAKTDDSPIVLEVFGTPVEVRPAVGLNLLALWIGAAVLSGRRKPERSWPIRLAIGGLSAAIWASGDFGHALAHIASARAAGAPMDVVRISQGMPRTTYYDNDVPPATHIIRSLGGPIFNTLGLLVSFALRALSPSGSLSRELAGDAMMGHGLLLAGSLVPLPIVDGGVILKWRLVQGGRSPEEADQLVKTAGVAAGAAALGAGAILGAGRRWLPALGLVGAGAVAIAAALGKLR